MEPHDKEIQKLKLMIADFQQKLANSDLATADARADLRIAEHEIAQLRDELSKAQASLRAAEETPAAGPKK